MENTTAGTQMLGFAGFISLRAGENVAIHAYASTDTSWSIKSQATLTFHFFGNYGSSPAFLVNPQATQDLSSPSGYHVPSWTKVGRAGLFQSLTGREILTLVVILSLVEFLRNIIDSSVSNIKFCCATSENGEGPKDY